MTVVVWLLISVTLAVGIGLGIASLIFDSTGLGYASLAIIAGAVLWAVALVAVLWRNRP